MMSEEVRRDHPGRSLDERDVAVDPLTQFRGWFEEAQASGGGQPNAMALATATRDGVPAVRMVLLKDADARGFVFFTNYESRKGSELDDNPRAALLFYWEPLQRQVRIEGSIEKVSADESNAYFASRPRASNLSAMASPQSRPVDNRADLDERVDRLEATWHGHELERPAHWGGYRLIPTHYEFWQGREDRLHDRIVYVGGSGGWRRARLAP